MHLKDKDKEAKARILHEHRLQKSQYQVWISLLLDPKTLYF